jgi:hypothetical protein
MRQDVANRPAKTISSGGLFMIGLMIWPWTSVEALPHSKEAVGFNDFFSD